MRKKSVGGSNNEKEKSNKKLTKKDSVTYAPMLDRKSIWIHWYVRAAFIELIVFCDHRTPRRLESCKRRFS